MGKRENIKTNNSTTEDSKNLLNENLVSPQELESYKTIFELSSDIIFILDNRGKILSCNNRVEEFLGWTPEEIIGLNVFSLPNLTMSSKVKALNSFRNRVKGGEIEPYILEFYTRQNELKKGEVRAKLLTDADGSIKGEIVLIANITKSLNNEQKLQESELKFKALANSTKLAIFIILENKFIYLNRATEEITGYNPAELLKMDFWDVVHPEHRELVKVRGLARQTGQDIESRYEFKLLTKLKQSKWIDFTGTLIEYEGKPALLGTGIDVTEKKMAESTLKISEARFREVFEKAKIGMYRSNVDGEILMANETLLKLFGHQTLAEFKRIDFKNEGYVEAGTREIFIQKIRKDGEINNFINAWRLRTGEIIYIKESARCVTDNNGNIDFFEGTIEDITARKTTEMELAKERRLLNSLLNSVPDTIYFKDLNSKFTKVNESMLKKHNFYSEEEVLGKTDFDLFAIEHAQEAFDDEQKIINTNKPIVGKIEKETWGENKFTWVSTNKLPLYDEDGNIVGTFGITRDITELMQATAKIESMNKELSESNESKDRFFSILAHDLKSPFTALLGYSEFLAEDFDELTLEEVKEFAGNIHKVATNVHTLLENLLDWSRIQSGKLTCEPKNISPYEITKQVLNLFGESAIRKKIKLESKLNPNDIVYADPNMLFTIIRNFLSNAIKFTDENGKISFTSSDKGTFIEYIVEDSGIGMSKEKIDEIINNEKIKSTHGTKNESGTGLGLLLCRDMINLNNGKMCAESKVGDGTKFYFTLPKA